MYSVLCTVCVCIVCYWLLLCSFSEDGVNLFSINLPVKLSSKKRSNSYLVKWRVSDWKEVTYRSTQANDMPTAIASR